MGRREIKIVVTGVEGVNKGAELMLYAILQEIERRFSRAVIYLPITQFPQGIKYIKTSLLLRQSPNKFVRFIGKNHITGVLNRLGIRLKYLNNLYPIKDADYYLDASGLHFSDQMIVSDQVAEDLRILLEGYNKQGTKIIYLPQAFGPFEMRASRNALKVALEYAHLIMPRDDKSENFIYQIQPDSSKIHKYLDFTGIVHGICPEEHSHLKNRVCIIPNKQVIRKGIMSQDDYVNLLTSLINVVYEEGYEAFFLDHADDIDIIRKCKETIQYDMPIVSGLDALSVKGIIAQSYMCISSRFHGVVSSFTSNVPCLTTSWSHKYQELLSYYGLSDLLLKSLEEGILQVRNVLSPKINKDIRFHLSSKNNEVKQNINEMWTKVWAIK